MKFGVTLTDLTSYLQIKLLICYGYERVSRNIELSVHILVDTFLTF